MSPASAETCQKVEVQIGYRFNNRDLLCEALHAGSRTYLGGRLLEDANKQMALIGHAVMDLVVFERAYEADKRYAKMDEHCGKVGKSDNLTAKCRANALADCLQHEHGVKAITDQMMATAVKAILGAVWRDSRDTGAVKKVMVKLALFEVLGPLEQD